MLKKLFTLFILFCFLPSSQIYGHNRLKGENTIREVSLNLEKPNLEHKGLRSYNFLLPAPTLTLISHSPQNGQFNVASNENITFQFAESIDASSLDSTNIQIVGSESGAIFGTFSGGISTNIVFQSNTNYKIGELINVVVTSNFSSTLGNNLVHPVVFSFRVETVKGFQLKDSTAIYWESKKYSGFGGVRRVSIVDLNRDGFQDIVASNLSAGNFVWKSSPIASSNPGLEIILLAGTGSYVLEVVDLNQDGHMELLASTTSDIYWIQYTGDALNPNSGNMEPTFSTTIVGPNFLKSRAITAVDLDLDGDMDFCAV